MLGAGSPLLPALPALPADHAVLPQKVRVVKIEWGHATAGRREAPDPSGMPRGCGSSAGERGCQFLGTSAPRVGVFPLGGGQRVTSPRLAGLGRGWPGRDWLI